MGLVKCKECGNSISDTANICPQCGAKASPKTSTATWIVSIIIVSFFVFAASNIVENSKNEPTQTAQSKEEGEKQQGGWLSGSYDDSMRGKTVKYYETKSLNKVSFSFPYNGGSTLNIMLVDRSGSMDAMLKVSKGQFITYDRVILAKFDDGKVERFSIVGASDGSKNVAFIDDSKRFISKLKKAKTVLIEAEFYSDGSHQFSFDVSGLELK